MKLKTLTVDKDKLYLLTKEYAWIVGVQIPPLEEVQYHKRLRQGFPCMEYEISFTEPDNEDEGRPGVTHKARLFPSGSEIRFELEELFPGDPPDRLLAFPDKLGPPHWSETLRNLGIEPSY